MEIAAKVKYAMLCIQRLSWEQGIAAQAIYELEGITEDVIRLCEAAVARSASDGRLAVMEKNESVNDPAAIGEVLIAVAEKTARKDYKEAADKLYHYIKYDAPRTEDGILYHFDGDWSKHQVWVDAYYMVPPFLCKYGDAKEAMKQIKGFRKYLYNKRMGLLSHIWDDDRKELGRKDFWGVGNGWALTGITRVIGLLDEKHQEDKDYLIDYLKELLHGCLTFQRDDGLFFDVLDDPQSFIETNMAQMLAYTIYRGIKAGYLDNRYMIFADNARNAVLNKVDEYGFVRDVCGMPHFDHPGIATEGQAFFLLMEAARSGL
ncbi:MAG TPA: glycosyl hydrolase [Clostridiales bacterium]|jgi:rhamnogalacturonyl hydrolase YesR|nr:glycosyl hydrolase [Clostridiales bacterium]